MGSDNKLFAISILCFLVFVSLFPSTHAHKTVQCGKPNVKVNEFPWMAHILVRNPSGRLLTCGGTLISAEHIITAAHCLIEDGSDSVFHILNITLGARDVSPDSNERIHRQVFNWKVLTVPEIHNNLTGHNIAIVALSKPAILNDYVQPACLPFASDSDQVNDSVVFTGWGHSTGALQCCSREASPVRRQWNTTVISSFGKNIQCRQSSTLTKFLGDNNLICTEGSQQRRFCNGDDGGSLNYYNSKWDRWFVIGIAGRANSDNCRMKSSSINANKRPNIFIRVRSHLDLIHEHSGVMPPVIKERAPQTSRGKNRMRSTTTRIPITSATGSKSANSLLMTVSFNCKGKPPGNYPNPTVSCSTDFFMCSDYNSYLLTCSHGLIYRADANVCDWPSNVPGCSSKSFTRFTTPL
ncbi:putative Serine-peptidase 212 [Daphnia magna]|uniref:Putative Serine-peptidase 212 n=1 Tax=Daphnia magna TaxID=35525 RepID=A0A164ZPS5_9CRUS|nr:putative Serine-peptidase 212 [Daphnia magna]